MTTMTTRLINADLLDAQIEKQTTAYHDKERDMRRTYGFLHNMTTVKTDNSFDSIDIPTTNGGNKDD